MAHTLAKIVADPGWEAKEMPDPMGTEFSVFIEEVNLGLPLGDALKKFEERMNLPEVRLFNTALMVQREVGGSLAELLTKLAQELRVDYESLLAQRIIQNVTPAEVAEMAASGIDVQLLP